MNRQEALSMLGGFLAESHCLHKDRGDRETCQQYRARMLTEPNSKCWNCLAKEALEVLRG